MQVLGRIVDAAGKPLGRIDDPKLTLVRDCRPVMLHRSADQAAAHAVSVLGDIEGKRPAFEPESPAEHDPALVATLSALRGVWGLAGR